MTEATTDAAAETTDAAESGQEGSSYTPPATQADLDRIIAERVNRTKAQFKDYADVKAKAARLDEIEKAQQTEAERLAEETARWQTEAQTWREQAVGSRIQALAADSFADPSDAVTALRGNEYLDAGGQIDDERIRADLADVLSRKPHWARQATDQGPRLPVPNAAQGTSGTPAATDPAAAFASIIQGQLRRS